MKRRLSLWQIINMNVGFFGIQFSFGLQQSNMSPIYKYLGAHAATLPLLWLAGPVTGLVLQPIIGSISDRTSSRLGRRTPFFLAGALACSVSLLAMPLSASLWMAAGLLWILDAANNVTMEPYRAFVGDLLQEEQYATGFLVQSAFTGLGQTLAYLTPSLLVWLGMSGNALGGNHVPEITRAAFFIGAAFSMLSILWTVLTTREAPSPAASRVGPGWGAALREVVDAVRDMPRPMRQMGLMSLFQWYAMFCYWQYIVLCLSQSLYGTTAQGSEAFRNAVLLNGQIGGFYNAVAFVAAFATIPLTRRHGARVMHAVALACGGLGMLAIPYLKSEWLLLLPMVGVGMTWASMMGNPYVILARSVPAERVGVYMGIFNTFIVIPMIIEILTMPLLYDRVLGGNSENAILFAGMLLLCASASMRLVSGQHAERLVPVVGSSMK